MIWKRMDARLSGFCCFTQILQNLYHNMLSEFFKFLYTPCCNKEKQSKMIKRFHLED